MVFVGYLWTGAIPYWIGHLMKWKVDPTVLGDCIPYYVSYYFFEHCSAWLLTVMTVERCVAIWFPLKAKKLCSVQNAVWVTVVVAVVFLIFDGQWFFVTEENISQYCDFKPSISKWYRKNFGALDATLYSYAPFLIMFVSNSMICYKMLKRNDVAPAETSQSMHKSTAMLLSVNMAFCCLTAPVSTYYIITDSPPPVLDAVLVNLGYLNHGINFMLYVLTGTKFRSEAIKKLRCRIRKVGPGAGIVTVSSTVAGGSQSPMRSHLLMPPSLQYKKSIKGN